MHLPLRWRLRLLLAAIAVVAYSNSFNLGFVLDAPTIIQGDPRVHALTGENLRMILTKDYWWPSSVDQLYRPVTTASWLLNYAVIGDGERPAGYHKVNLVLHIINAWLVLELVSVALPAIWPAFLAAVIWTVHPVATEAVTNIIGRSDLLSTAAVLSGLLLYLGMRTAEGRGFWLRLAALFGVALVGVFSKENAVVLPGLMLLTDIAFPAMQPRRGMLRVVPYVATLTAIAIMLAARHFVFAAAPYPEVPFVDNPLKFAGVWAARFTAIKVLGHYLWLLLCPIALSADRAFRAIPLSSPSDGFAWLALVVVVALLAAVLIRWRRDRVLFWAAGFFAIALLPTSNLVLVVGSIMAERFLYLPSVGFALALSALAFRLQRPRLAPALLIAIALLFTVRTPVRNRAWQSDLTLAQTDIAVAPGSFRLHDMLGFALYRQDPRANLDRAIQEGEAAWAILAPLTPGRIYQQAPAHLGMYYLYKGDLARPEAGGAWYEKALAVLLRAREASVAGEKAYDRGQLEHGKPLTTRLAFEPLYFVLSSAYARLGRYDEAIEAARYGRNLDPSAASGYDEMARHYIAAGNSAQAAIILDEKALVLGISPGTAAALRRAYGSGSCALADVDGAPHLNLACPALRADMCRAWTDLAGAFTEARMPNPAAYFRQTASAQKCAE